MGYTKPAKATSHHHHVVSHPENDQPETIKVDLSATLRRGVQKALAYNPKWGTHKPKAPTSFFPDAASYIASRRSLTPYKGHATATAGRAKHSKTHHKEEPGLFLATSYLGHGGFTLGRRFDARDPKQAAELRQLRDGAKTFDQAMVPVRVTYTVHGKTKTENLPLLFVHDSYLNLETAPARRDTRIASR